MHPLAGIAETKCQDVRFFKPAWPQHGAQTNRACYNLALDVKVVPYPQSLAVPCVSFVVVFRTWLRVLLRR